MKNKIWIITFSVWMLSLIALADKSQKFELTKEWEQTIQKLAPANPTVKPLKKHKILVFSLATGYKHWVIPHTSAMLKILGEKSGAFDVVVTTNIMMFKADALKEFDAIVLNNTCPKSPRRNIFLDVLGDGAENEKIAKTLEENILNFVKEGRGLIVLHGGITMQNNSPEFSKMVGGSFDFHPSLQKVTLTLTDPNHPLLKAFKGKPFIHSDEPYMFKNAYADKNFHPLLILNTDILKYGKNKKQQKKIQSDIRYVAWIKKYGKGRVFFSSPSHEGHSFEQPELLQFFLDGIQYALGDLTCDDSPLKKEK